MIAKRCVIFLFLFCCLVGSTVEVSALVPLKSLILGDFSEVYSEEISDPLNYIFVEDQKKIDSKRVLAAYRGFIQTGDLLRQSCRHSPKIKFASGWNRQQVTRSILSTLQYIGLDITIRALAKYAKIFEFTGDEYQNFTDRLVGNYCSRNISIFSHKLLRDNLKIKFEKENNFTLPTIEGNELFAASLANLNIRDQYLEQEFLHTVKLFRAFCSWGGDVYNMRLMVPLVRNPVVMAFIIRQMTGKIIDWDPIDNVAYTVDSPNTVRVACQNYICRRFDASTFKRKISGFAGGTGIASNMERLYCQDLKRVDYVYKGQEAQVKQWIDQTSLEEQNLMTGQFIALLTGIPDFFVRMAKFKDGVNILRSSFDDVWMKWAIKQNEKFSRDLYFEETLTIEKVERDFYFNRYYPDFKVVFDLNFGEFDRTNQMVGKLKTSFYLKISRGYLRWIRNKWRSVGREVGDYTSNRDVTDSFKEKISKQVKKIRANFQIPPWKGDLEYLIVKELLIQFDLYNGDYFERGNRNDIIQIPIEINYAPFALKYINYKRRIMKR